VITCIDLFCGLGGLTHGLIRSGIRVVAGIDLDPACRFPYEKNNDSVFVEKDVRDLTGSEIRSHWPHSGPTLLAGCAPCQSFSTYSRKGRKLREDDKWNLAAHFGRLVKETSPDIVTMENVPQLIDHPIFTEFKNSLAAYHVWYDVVECSHHRVPQTRKRLVLLASKFGPVELRPTCERAEGIPTVRKAITHLRSLAAGKADPNDGLHSACRLSELNLRRIMASKPGGSWRDWDHSLIAKCHRKKSGDTYPSVYGRMEWDAPAPTITTQCFGYGNGRFGHPEQNRAITLREAAILQTFPDTYQFLPKGEKVRYSVLGRLIGNAVPVRLAEAIGNTLVRHVDEFGS